MTDLPAPLVPAEVDLRDFSWMPIEIHRLRRSKAWLICKRKPELGFYMLNLWTAAWHDTPSASLEDDDDVLADLAMCEPSKWPKVREQVLRGWIKCSDGRLYHPVVADLARGAWTQKQAQRLRTEAARQAREQKRQQAMQQSGASATTDNAAKTVAISVTEHVTASNGTEQTGEGPERRGTGDSGIPPSAGAAAPPGPPPNPPPPSAVDTIFAVGLPLLQQAQVPERNARTFLGHLRKLAKAKGGDDAVVRALNACVQEGAVDPVTYLQACFSSKANGSTQPDLDELAAGVRRRLGVLPPTAEAIDG